MSLDSLNDDLRDKKILKSRYNHFRELKQNYISIKVLLKEAILDLKNHNLFNSIASVTEKNKIDNLLSKL